MLIADACVFVSVATVSVCGCVPLTAAEVKFSVTPVIAPVTVLLALVAAMPLIVKAASCAAVLCFQAALLLADAMDDWPPVVLAVDVTPRLERPLSPVTLLTATLIAFAAPVGVELSTRCAPSLPLTTDATMPGLPVVLLIAAAMPDSVLLLLPTLTVNDLLPSDSVIVPVPSAVDAPNAADDSDCDVAICVTPTE